MIRVLLLRGRGLQERGSDVLIDQWEMRVATRSVQGGGKVVGGEVVIWWLLETLVEGGRLHRLEGLLRWHVSKYRLLESRGKNMKGCGLIWIS